MSSIHKTKNPTQNLEITMNVLYSMVYKYCAKSVDAEENQNDTEMVFHMTFIVYFTFMLV